MGFYCVGLDIGGIQLKGFKDTTADLPLIGNSLNDIWIVRSNDHWYTYNSESPTGLITDWVDMGGAAAVDWSIITSKPTSSVGGIDGAVSASHARNADQKLDEGGANEVSANQILKTTTAALTYYIDPAGDDGNPGTNAEPFATIQHAVDILPKIINHTVSIILKDGTYTEQVTLGTWQAGQSFIGSGRIWFYGDSCNADLAIVQKNVDGVFILNNVQCEVIINWLSIKVLGDWKACVYVYNSPLVWVNTVDLGDNGNANTKGVDANYSTVHTAGLNDIDANKVAIGLYSAGSIIYRSGSSIGDTAEGTSNGGFISYSTQLNDAIAARHTQNSDTQLDSGVLEVDASDNLVLTQNSVAVMTSLNASAVVNTLYLKEGKVGIGIEPTSTLDLVGTITINDSTKAEKATISRNLAELQINGGIGGNVKISAKGSQKVIIGTAQLVCYVNLNPNSNNTRSLGNNSERWKSIYLAGNAYVGGTLILASGTSVNEFSIDGTLAGASDDAAPTEKAVKTYADTKIANIIEDTTPELGGEMDCGEHSIGFTEKANVVVANAVTIDWKNSNKQLLTVDANVTITFTAPTNPGSLTLRIVQSGAGHTTTLPTIKWASGNTPTISSGDADVDIVSLYFAGGSTYYGNASLDFS